MADALTVHRLHFAFTVTYHYISPQRTMGLALLIVILKMVALHQPTTLAAMEGLFSTKEGAPLVIVVRPDVVKRRLDNSLVVPLSAGCAGTRSPPIDGRPLPL